MDRYQETFNTWDKVADSYEERFMGLTLYDQSYDHFCNLLDVPSAKLLDVGCGPGNITKFILSKRADFEIIGIDISPNMLTLAKKNNPSASFSLLDCRNIDRLNTNFDGIISGFCLPYLSSNDCSKFFKDCYNLLNENGLLYISFVSGEKNNSGYQVRSNGDRIYFYYHELDIILSQLSESFYKVEITLNVEYLNRENEIEIHTIIFGRK